MLLTLQKFVFPEGVTYNREKGLFLTSKVNSLFEPIARLNCISEADKNKQGSIAAALSNWVGTTRFELATPCTPCKCATGLRYVPKLYKVTYYRLHQQVVTNGGANVKQKILFPEISWNLFQNCWLPALFTPPHSPSPPPSLS